MFEVAGRRTSPRRGALFFFLGGLVAAWAGLANPAAASGLTTLYSYCGQSDCSDGSQPEATMIVDSAGNLYGTTFYGGAGYGTLFKQRGHRAPTVLHSFCAACADGTNPIGSLIMDVNGHLYGTASGGGAHGGGTIFELVPNAKRTKWRIGRLYGFCSLDGCADGSHPAAGLTYKGAETGALYDGKSPLYGTTSSGGLHSSGAVFRVVPGDHLRFNVKVLYNFCSQNNCTDGYEPRAALLTDEAGNLYGTTRAGGTAGFGVVFELKAKKRGFVPVLLHSFAVSGDGAYPNSALTWDGSGNLLGTTEGGGSKGSGAVFRVMPNGSNSLESLLYSFCQRKNCIDGDQPWGGVVVGANGNLFGLTRNGGGQGNGTAYRLSGSGESVVYSFCTLESCNDGAHPEAGLVSDGAGGFFGTTTQGGIHGGGGTIFSLNP